MCSSPFQTRSKASPPSNVDSHSPSPVSPTRLPSSSCHQPIAPLSSPESNEYAGLSRQILARSFSAQPTFLNSRTDSSQYRRVLSRRAQVSYHLQSQPLANWPSDSYPPSPWREQPVVRPSERRIRHRVAHFSMSESKHSTSPTTDSMNVVGLS